MAWPSVTYAGEPPAEKPGFESGLFSFVEVAQQDSTGHRIVSPVVDENGNEYDVMQERCVEIDFPGKYQGMTRFMRRQTVSGPVAWMGSLMQDGQDASGLLFRRNRYYDPASGRFTQEDPIGLAGGVNSYGGSREVIP